MLITRATEYAIRAVLYLAKQPAGEVVLKKDICRTQDITPAFLTKIFQPLIKAGIVGSQRGVGGGFYLARNPEAVSLLDIIEAQEGELLFNYCLQIPGTCERDITCPVHDAWAKVRGEVKASLQSVCFDELIRNEKTKLKVVGMC